MEPGDLATWVASGIALAALVIAAYERRQANKAEAQRQLLEKRNAELVERAWADSHFQAVQRWAEEVCHTISESRHLVGRGDAFASQRIRQMARLSSLIDTGRWYFPNTHSDIVGSEKELAFRGLRQPVLDYVVYAYRALESDWAEAAIREELVSCQRQFVSDIQRVIDPRRRENEIEQYLKRLPEPERSFQSSAPPRGESSPPLPRDSHSRV